MSDTATARTENKPLPAISDNADIASHDPAKALATTPDRTVEGRVHISERAITRIVEAACASVPGTTRVNRSLEKLSRSYPRFDVMVEPTTPGSTEAGSVSVEAHIAITWPIPAADVAMAVRDTIIHWVEKMTGLYCTRVNVVVGTAVSDQQTRASLLKPAQISPETLAQMNLEPPTTPIKVPLTKVYIPETPPAPTLRQITTTQQAPRLAKIHTATPLPLAPVKIQPLHPLSPAAEISGDTWKDADNTHTPVKRKGRVQ